MTHYPIFIPIYPGICIPIYSGGSNEPLNKKHYLFLLGLCGFYGYLLYNIKHPRFTLYKKNNTLYLYVNKDIADIPYIRHYNIDCLLKKGYTVTMDNENIYGIYHNRIVSNNADIITINESPSNNFREDCKSCNIYSLVSYTTSPILLYGFCSKSQHTKKIYWKDFKEWDELQ